MIPLPRTPVTAQMRELLARRTRNAQDAGGAARAARTEWDRAHAPKKHVRTALEAMARGAVRCMYCDDSRATDIDHFEPLERAPLRAFEWLNHLLACAHRNSNAQREQYPVDGRGNCLLVDPTAGDPADHLRLLLHTGEYAAVSGSPKGRETIRVFGLNRPDLVKGRQDALHRARSNLRDWRQLGAQADHEAAREAARVARALLDSPFVDVVHAMARLAPAVALIVLGPLTVPALDAWKAAMHAGQ